MEFNVFWTVFKAAAKDTIFSSSKYFKFNNAKKAKNEEPLSIGGRGSKNASKALGKVGIGILMGFGIIALLSYLIIFVSTTTLGALQANLHRELLFTLVGFVQVMVLFLGSMTTLNFLYFSKDNQLLITLPIRNNTIFAVKFALSYLSELLISVFMGLPMLITYGVVLGLNGINLGVSYYILSVISVLILPIIPLLAISLLSVPLMYIASYLKKRVIGKSLVVAFIAIFFMAIYFMFIGGATRMGSNLDESGMPIMSNAIASLVKGGSSVGFFNYNLINALLMVKPLLNFAIYLIIIAVIFGVALLLSSLFYKKGISVALEDSNTSKKVQNVKEEKKYVKNTFRKTFFFKEVKTVFATPSLFMNSIIGMVAIPLFMIIMGGKTFNFSDANEVITMGTELGTIGFLCYLSSIMMASTNTLSLVGFSLEGKNISILKSLPLEPKDILVSKLLVANIYNLILSVIAGGTYVFTSQFHNVFIGLVIVCVLFVNGLAVSAIGLYDDIKKPNFKYKNLNELTKNNKKALKPMLISLAIGFSYMIMGILLAMATSSANLKTYLAYLIFFGISFLINGLFGFITFRKLFDNIDEYFNKIEV